MNGTNCITCYWSPVRVAEPETFSQPLLIIYCYIISAWRIYRRNRGEIFQLKRWQIYVNLKRISRALNQRLFFHNSKNSRLMMYLNNFSSQQLFFLALRKRQLCEIHMYIQAVKKPNSKIHAHALGNVYIRLKSCETISALIWHWQTFLWIHVHSFVWQSSIMCLICYHQGPRHKHRSHSVLLEFCEKCLI